jgi:wobble nucleotide-excising tRNase
MKIKKFKNIDFITFEKFQWDSNVPNFHPQVNIFLGWNGTGKTIISRLFRAYEKGVIEDKLNGATFSMELDISTKKQNELSGFENKVKVFNEDYIQEIVGKTHLDYVVVLGKTEVDFSRKQKELDDAKDAFSKIKKCKNEHDDIAKNTADEIRRIPGIGHIKKDPSVENNGVFNSYNKSSFEKRINALSEQVKQEKKIGDFIQSEEELQKLQKELSNLAEKEREYAILKKWNDWINGKLEKINWSLEFIPTYEQSQRLEAYEDWSKEGKWISEGVEIHKLTDKKNQLTTCLFCDSTIENRDELLKHFSNDVVKLNNALDALDQQVTSALSEISSCKTFYISEKESLKSFFETLQKKIIERKKDKLKSVDKTTFKSLFTEEETFNQESTAWKIETDYVARKYAEYIKKKTEYSECEKIFKQKQEAINKLDHELKELKKTAKNVKIPADRINRLLESTFPYKKIQLDDSGDEVGYILERNNIQCSLDSLSEGERNFLALAYFLLSINDEEDKKLDDQSVIVIDDPVSSLDSDSLFQVYAILFGEIERHKDRQYFIFTHNLDFFGHLLQEYKKGDGQIKDNLVNFYQVKLEANGSVINCLSDNLKNYRSDYQYAISKLYEIKDSQNLDDNILAANLLRRALETFLHFKYGHGDLKSKLERLYSKYKKIKLNTSDPTKKEEIEQEVLQEEKAMYRFINHGSHEFLGIEKYDISVLQGSKQRIENFLNVIKTTDKDHYDTFTFNSNDT